MKSTNSTSKPLEGEVTQKHPGGRPPKLTPIERAEVYNAFVDYIARTPDPTVVGFVAYDPVAAKHFLTRENIKDWEEFSPLVKHCIQKQEAYLLQAGGTGRYNPTMAIFRLKQPQHGYSDKQEVENTITMAQPILGGLSTKNIAADAVHSDSDDV